MSFVSKALIAIFAALFLFALIAFIIATPLWLLWNWLMPIIFGLTKITWLQALGLAFLSAILFKGHSTSSSN